MKLARSQIPIRTRFGRTARDGHSVQKDKQPRYWYFALASLLLAGCLHNPPYQRPDVLLPQDWKARLIVGAQAADNWWDEFGDPQLQRLLDQSVAGNLDLQVAIDRVLIARDTIKAARSHLYPSLAINGGPPDPVNSQVVIIGDNGRRLDVDPNLFAVSLEATYEIDFWGRVSNSIAAAKSDYQASVFDAGAALIGLRSEVARAYFNVRELDEEIGLSAQRSALASDRLRLMRLRQSAGRVAAGPVIDAENAERDEQANAESLQISRGEAVNALAVLIGVNPESLEIAPAPLRTTVRAPIPPEGLPSEILERRPDIRAAEARLAAAHAQIAVARAEMFPQIALTAEFGYVASAVHNLSFTGSTIIGGGPTVKYSIFDAGRLDAQLDASRRQQDLLLAEYRKSILAGLADVEKALLSYQRASSATARWSAAQGKQQAQLQRLDQSLAAGRLSRFEVIAAQDRAIDLEYAAVRSYRDHLDSMVSLYQALGGGWTPAKLPLPTDAPAGKQSDSLAPPTGGN